MKKNSCTPINPKKYSCYGLKKIHTRNLITKKNSCSSKIPLPPITFLMVRPLLEVARGPKISIHHFHIDHNEPCLPSKILHNFCFQLLSRPKRKLRQWLCKTRPRRIMVYVKKVWTMLNKQCHVHFRL